MSGRLRQRMDDFKPRKVGHVDVPDIGWPPKDASRAEDWADHWAAWAAGARRFNMTHVPAGSPTGGEFGTSGGGSGTAKAPAKGAHPATAAIHARQAHLRERAAADRAQARRLEAQLHALQAQEKHAHAAAVKAAHAAKAAAGPHHPQSAKAIAAHKAAAAHRKARGHHATLKTRIAGLQHQISTLLGQARQLDAQAAAL